MDFSRDSVKNGVRHASGWMIIVLSVSSVSSSISKKSQEFSGESEAALNSELDLRRGKKLFPQKKSTIFCFR